MNITFTKYVAENFGQEAVDNVIYVCNLMERIDFDAPSLDFAEACIYIHDNYKKIIQIAEFVDGVNIEYNVPSGWDYFDVWSNKYEYDGVMVSYEARQVIMIGASIKALLSKSKSFNNTRDIIKAII